MSEKDQYAFPGERYTQGGIKSGHGQGMSMRDWFAGQVISGLYARGNTKVLEEFFSEYSRIAYKIADAMLEARK